MAPEALVQRLVEIARVNPLQQVVPQPVRLHDPAVERVADAVRRRYRPQVGHGAGELGEQWSQRRARLPGGCSF